MLQSDVQILEDPQGKGGIQFVLVFKVQVEGSRTEFGFVGDVFHGRLVEALFREDTLGGHDDLLASPFPFAFFTFLYAHKIMNGI